MNPAQSLQGSAAAARSVYEFTLLPALGMHPDRAAKLIPLALASCSPAARSAGVMAQLGIPHELSLNLDEVAHRAALLPAPSLQALGRHLLLLAAMPMLRRLIVRHELEQLSTLLSENDWAMVFTPLEKPVVPIPEAPWVQEAPALADALRAGATPLIEWASYALPAAIGLRLRLKLPIAPWSTHRPADEQSRACLRLLESHYAASSPGWDPKPWDALWLDARGREA